MSKEATINSNLLDRAIVFAVNAHKNVERRGKGFPYIAHPLEAMSIVATMTNDQELLAAACLHDVIEDTEITYEDIKKEFGQRVADLVKSESDVVIVNKSASESWKERKQAAIDHLKHASREVQMVALGDKLSNMRALARDYRVIGDELWNRFHVTDPRLHAWHYRGLADSLSTLSDTAAFQEFMYLINETFSDRYEEFAFNFTSDNEISFQGEIDKAAVETLKEKLTKNKQYVFDFLNVFNVNFSGIRGFMLLKHEGYRFVIRRASARVNHRFDITGASREISVLRNFKEYTKYSTLEQSGDGYTAVTYWTPDQDAMVKFYYNFVDMEEVEKEKRYAREAMLLGVPTPLSGDLIEADGRHGIIFERIEGKVSFARALSNNPERYDELGKDYALLAKKLHATQCNTLVFPNAKEQFLSYLYEFQGLEEHEKDVIAMFIRNVPDCTTCLQGDFHMGNAIITKDNEKLFIDMGDFAYGHPYFDLGVFYFVTHSKNEDRNMELFHTSGENLYKFYQSFIKYYFEGKEEAEVEQLLRPFGALTALLFAHKTNDVKPWMTYVLRDAFFRK